MGDKNNKKELFDRMKENMKLDRAKHHILILSKFGLMEITRERVRPQVTIETNESCPVCKGTGKISSSIIFVDELENLLSYIFSKTNHKEILLKVHPYVEAYINKGLFRSLRKNWIKKFKRKITVQQSTSYNYMEYHFFDSKGEEIII
jgi:ribonuclease G